MLIVYHYEILIFGNFNIIGMTYCCIGKNSNVLLSTHSNVDIFFLRNISNFPFTLFFFFFAKGSYCVLLNSIHVSHCIKSRVNVS